MLSQVQMVKKFQTVAWLKDNPVTYWYIFQTLCAKAWECCHFTPGLPPLQGWNFDKGGPQMQGHLTGLCPPQVSSNPSPQIISRQPKCCLMSPGAEGVRDYQPLFDYSVNLLNAATKRGHLDSHLCYYCLAPVPAEAYPVTSAFRRCVLERRVLICSYSYLLHLNSASGPFLFLNN